VNASLEISAKEQRLGIFKQRGTSQNLSLSDSRIGNEMSSINFLDVVRSVARPRGWVAGDARTADKLVTHDVADHRILRQLLGDQLSLCQLSHATTAVK